MCIQSFVFEKNFYQIAIFQMIRVSKGGILLSGWQIAQNSDCFCDLGEN